MSDRPKNAFLRDLSPGFEHLSEHLQTVDLSLGRQLHQPGDRLEWVYFPLTALLSVITTTAAGDQVETALVGNEGALGLVEACGSGVVGMVSIVQIDGEALRAPAAVFRRQVAADEDLWNVAWRLIELQLAESRQSGMCQAVHGVESRLARWLLESMERCGGRNPIPMTQKFLAAMLGVQRTTVTAFAAQLQNTGLISYSQGRLQITDISGLEKRACECRDVTRRHRRRLRLEPIPVHASARLELVAG